jgi:hypothetical protein
MCACCEGWNGISETAETGATGSEESKEGCEGWWRRKLVALYSAVEIREGDLPMLYVLILK